MIYPNEDADIDTKYRHIVKIYIENPSDRQYHFMRITSRQYGKQSKHESWLCLIGLIETWDMT